MSRVRASRAFLPTRSHHSTPTAALTRQIAPPETLSALSQSAPNETPRISGAPFGFSENAFDSEAYHTPENQRPVTMQRVAKKRLAKSLGEGQIRKQVDRSSFGSSTHPTPKCKLWPGTTNVEPKSRSYPFGELPESLRKKRRYTDITHGRRRSQRLAEKRQRQENEHQLPSGSKTHHSSKSSALRATSATRIRSKRA